MNLKPRPKNYGKEGLLGEKGWIGGWEGVGKKESTYTGEKRT